MLPDLAAITERLAPDDPLAYLAVVLVHPDAYEDMKAKLPPAPPAPSPLAAVAGIELLSSSFVPKTRAMLLDRNRLLIAFLDLTTGQCYILPKAKALGFQRPFPPSFNFAEITEDR